MRQREDQSLGAQIEQIFQRHKRRYGYRRIAEELRGLGLTCSDERVRGLMKERELVAIQPKTYVPRTSDGRADAPSPNFLANQKLPSAPNQVLA